MSAPNDALLRDEAGWPRERTASPSRSRPKSPGISHPATPNSHHDAASAKLNALAGVSGILVPTTTSGVYFVERDGLVKVGHTHNIRQRVRNLGGKRAHLLAIGYAGWRVRDAELLIHDAFRAHHVGGEWFTPTPELVALIRDVQRTGLIPEPFNREIGYFNRPERLHAPGWKPKPRKLHFTHRRALERARLLLTVAALIERRLPSCATQGGVA
jgi:hypothetical protein